MLELFEKAGSNAPLTLLLRLATTALSLWKSSLRRALLTCTGMLAAENDEASEGTNGPD